MKREIIPHNGGQILYEGKAIRVEIVGRDAWIMPRYQYRRRRGKRTYVTKAIPIPLMVREEFVQRFDALNPNWTQGLSVEQKELLKEALEILPMTGSLNK